MDSTLLARRLVMGMFGNRMVAAAAQRYGMRLGASRFIAGDSLPAAITAVRTLNTKGISATLDYLGESVTEPEEAQATVRAYLSLLDAIAAARVDANVSLKLTALGLAIDKSLAAHNLRRIVQRAAQLGNFVRVDMEDTPHTDSTLDLFRLMRREFDNVGIVIQAYLYRSQQDLLDLAASRANVRLVKGAYREPPELAHPRKAGVDAAFNQLIRLRLLSGLYTAVATHDQMAIEYTLALVAEQQIPRDRFEFQMLYGIRQGLQEDLARQGYKVRCYVPYGTHWYPYFVRRLAERPANLMFVARNLVRA